MRTKGKWQHSVRFYLTPYESKKSKLKPMMCYIHRNQWMNDYKADTFSIGIKLHPDFWDGENQIAIAPYDYVNSQLDVLRMIITKTFNQYEFDVPSEDFKDEILEKWTEVKPKITFERLTERYTLNPFADLNAKIDIHRVSFCDYIRTETENIKREVKSTSDYKLLLAELEKFHSEKNIAHILLSQLTYQYFAEFLYYLKENRIWTVQYFGKFVKNIKKFYNRLNEIHKLNVPLITFKEDKKIFKKISGKNDSKDCALSIAQIKKLIAVDFTPEENILERARDKFVMGCFLGLRISDLNLVDTIQSELNLSLKKEVRFIEGINIKTKAPVKLPMHYLIEPILKKYNDSVPKISDEDFEKEIKTVCEKAGLKNKIRTTKENLQTGYIETKFTELFKLVTTGTMRKTFCTMGLRELEMQIDEIMTFSGHQNITSFEHYLADTGENTTFNKLAEKFSKPAEKSALKKAK